MRFVEPLQVVSDFFAYGSTDPTLTFLSDAKRNASRFRMLVVSLLFVLSQAVFLESLVSLRMRVPCLLETENVGFVESLRTLPDFLRLRLRRSGSAIPDSRCRLYGIGRDSGCLRQKVVQRPKRRSATELARIVRVSGNTVRYRGSRSIQE